MSRSARPEGDNNKTLALDDVEKNSQLLNELNHLILKQQAIISKAFQSGLVERNKKGNSDRVQTRLRYRGIIPKGCRVRIYKQDPSVKRIGVRSVYLPNEVSAGPSDNLVRIRLDEDTKTKKQVVPNADGDMIVDEVSDPFGFDLVQVYSVVRIVINMYQRDLQRPFCWQWDNGKPPTAFTPIDIVAHAGVAKNAAYVRSKKLMKFYFFHDDDSKRDVYLCRSLDIVAHETGHAVLDSLKPCLYSVQEGQPAALHEAFADCTAMFAVLSQMDLCEDIIAATKGNLRSEGYLSNIGEEFGSALQETEPEALQGDQGEPHESSHNSVLRGVRNLNNDMTGSKAKETYHLALVFGGYVFDILCDCFDHERCPGQRDDAETLYRVARLLRRILVLAISSASDTPNFIEISKGMERAVTIVAADDDLDEKYWQEAIRKYRVDRELEGKRAGLDVDY